MLLPVFVFLLSAHSSGREECRIAAIVVFVIAAFSDWLDGYVARHFNQRSKLGALLDPLADKLFVNISLVFMAVNESFAYGVPKWFPVLVLTRDVVIAGGSFLISERFRSLNVKPRIAGKLTTVIILFYMFCVLIFP